MSAWWSPPAIIYYNYYLGPIHECKCQHDDHHQRSFITIIILEQSMSVNVNVTITTSDQLSQCLSLSDPRVWISVWRSPPAINYPNYYLGAIHECEVRNSEWWSPVATSDQVQCFTVTRYIEGPVAFRTSQADIGEVKLEMTVSYGRVEVITILVQSCSTGGVWTKYLFL